MTFDLIYPAIIAFFLMLIGIVLTAIEFSHLGKKEAEEKERSKRRDGGSNPP